MLVNDEYFYFLASAKDVFLKQQAIYLVNYIYIDKCQTGSEQTFFVITFLSFFF